MTSIIKIEYENGTHSDGAKEYNNDSNEYMDSWKDDFSDDETYVSRVSTAVYTPVRRPVKLQRVKASEEEKQREAIEIAAVGKKLNWLDNKKVNTTDNVAVANNEDFPILGTMPKPKPKHKPVVHKQIPHTGKNSTKVDVSKLINGTKSYKEELDERRQTITHEQRSKAFEILTNKDGLQKNLFKTRMCKSVGKNKCQYGDKCQFAHNLDELNISTCVFGDKCRLVKVINCKLLNKGIKICNHKHSQESKEEFFTRTCHYKPKNPVELHEFGSGYLKMEAKRETIQPSIGITNLMPPPPPPTPVMTPLRPRQEKQNPPLALEIEDVVLRVPKELALQMLEMAINSGKTNIRVIIV